ncbi:MAG: nucleotide exchange factor GrpE [Elusimicrobiales bacterium]|nr:nucleotide exchange factor GrpE [Elusimicrobiales bacterium]
MNSEEDIEENYSDGQYQEDAIREDESQEEISDESGDSQDGTLAESAESGSERPQQKKKGFFGKMFGNSESEISAELEKQTNLAKEYYNQLLSIKADFENFRKRMEREKPELIKYGKADILAKLLPMYDLMLAAGKHLETVKNPELSNTVMGLKMVFKEFEKIFDSEGMRPMDIVGKPYDPMATEILGIVDGDDSNDGLVVEELQKGFYLGDKILRPARVKIARKKAAVPTPAEENKDAAEEEKSVAENDAETGGNASF